MSKNTRNRILLTAVAALLLVCVAVGGTIAWLADASGPVVNTFKPSSIDVTITETQFEEKMIPGKPLAKNPSVTYSTPDVGAYVFVKVELSNNFANFIEWGINTGWNLIAGTEYVYYQEVQAGTGTLQVLADNQVTVLTTVTDEMMSADSYTDPTMTFTSYIIQKDYLVDQNNDGLVDVNDAWALAAASATPTNP